MQEISQMDVPVDIENIHIKLYVDRLRREVDFLKEELNRSASIISSLSTAPSSSSSSSSSVGGIATESTITSTFSESSASSLNQLATILTLSIQQSSSSTNTQSSSSTSLSAEPVYTNDLQNIHLNLDVERLSRERDYLRGELTKTQIVKLPAEELPITSNMNILKSCSTLIESPKKDKKGQKAPINTESSMTDELLLPPTKERRPRGPNKKKSTPLSALSDLDLTTEESSHLLLALSQKQQPKIQTERKQASAKSAAKEATKAAKAAKAAAKEAKMSVSTLASLSVSTVLSDMPSGSGAPGKTKKSKSSGIKHEHSTSLVPQNIVQSQPIISTWDLCSFIVKRLQTDVTNFKYNLKRKHHDHSITQLQGRYYVCKVCYNNTRSIEVLHHASLDYVKFITLHFKKEHKDLVQSSDNDDFLPYIISIPIPKEIISTINTTNDNSNAPVPPIPPISLAPLAHIDPIIEPEDVYSKMKSILNNEDGADKKSVRKCIDDALRSVETLLIRFKDARLDLYIRNYIKAMPTGINDVKILLDANSYNYYAYFSAVEQKADSKNVLLLESDYYDDIDNINDHINNNNRDNTTKIKKYTKFKRAPLIDESMASAELSLSDFSTPFPLFPTIANIPDTTNITNMNHMSNITNGPNVHNLIKMTDAHKGDVFNNANKSSVITMQPSVDSDSDSESDNFYSSYYKRKAEKSNVTNVPEKKPKIDQNESDEVLIFVNP